MLVSLHPCLHGSHRSFSKQLLVAYPLVPPHDPRATKIKMYIHELLWEHPNSNLLVKYYNTWKQLKSVPTLPLTPLHPFSQHLATCITWYHMHQLRSSSLVKYFGGSGQGMMWPVALEIRMASPSSVKVNPTLAGRWLICRKQPLLIHQWCFF